MEGKYDLTHNPDYTNTIQIALNHTRARNHPRLSEAKMVGTRSQYGGVVYGSIDTLPGDSKYCVVVVLTRLNLHHAANLY